MFLVQLKLNNMKLLIACMLIVIPFCVVNSESVTIDLNKGIDFVEFLCPTNSDFVLWYKGDVELPFSNSRITYPFSISVKIANLTILDSGTYSCKVPAEEIVHVADFDLKVLPIKEQSKVEPIEWIIAPSGKLYRTNERAIILGCRAKSKETKIRAYKILNDGEIKEYSTSGIVLHRPKAEDSGKYACEASRDGITDTKFFELTIRVDGVFSPWATWENCNVECGYGYQSRYRNCTNPAPANGGRPCLGEKKQTRRCRSRRCSSPKLVKFGFDMSDGDLKLFCQATGIPKPTVLWRFNGRALPSIFRPEEEKMTIPKNKKRSGMYSCKIQNASGFFQRYLDIKV